MANRTVNRKNYISYNDYIEGNAVRKENVVEVPQRRERTYIDNQRVSTSKNIYRNREKALHMSASYVVVLAICSILMCVVCAKYLSLRDEVTRKTESIADLEMKTESLKAQNDSLDYTINSFMDIANISKIAKEELGMIQAGKDQISFYDSSESEYMKQYKDIPTN